MDWDDIVYVLLLFFSIGCGQFYRKIQNPEDKKVIGSLIGLGIVIIVSGFHIAHILIFTFINIVIIFSINKRLCHLVSFAFSFSYLLFFRTTIYFGIPYPPAHTNLVIMMLTLKLVGLAFEVNTSFVRKQKSNEDLSEEVISEYEFTDATPSVLDVVHYAFNYVGILTGPYISYRSYWDSIHLPYSKHANCQAATLENFKYVPVFAVLFLWATYTWPLSYALSDEFYADRSWMYRLFYVIPIFTIFRLRIYIGILLSMCVCTMAGIGAYPKFCDPKPGRGPSTNFALLKKHKNEGKNLGEDEYSFGTITNTKVYEVETCTTFRESMKHWNITIQYWMAVNVYKRFPNKQFRTLATLFVSSFWHGVYIGHYFCIGGAPFVLPVEDLYYKLLLKDYHGKWVKVLEWLFWICKMFALSYLGMAFQLLTVTKVMRFYNSVYHMGALSLLLFYVVGLLIVKSQPRKERSSGEGKKSN